MSTTGISAKEGNKLKMGYIYTHTHTCMCVVLSTSLDLAKLNAL